MKTTATATAAAILPETTDPVFDPSPRQVEQADSIHVLGFTRQGGLLLSESDGHFSQEEWDRVHNMARNICVEENKDDIAMALDDDSSRPISMANFIREEAEAKTDSDLHWK